MQNVHDGEEKHHVKLSRFSTNYETTEHSEQLPHVAETHKAPANVSSHGSSMLFVNGRATSLNWGDAGGHSQAKDVEFDRETMASSGFQYPMSGVDKHPMHKTPSGIQASLTPDLDPPIEHSPSDRSSGDNKEEAATTDKDDVVPSPYPEGGLKAWSVVFGSFSGMTASFGILNSAGTFQAYLSTHQLAQESPSSVGWIFSLLAFLTFFCGVQIGPVFDAKGPRWLVAAGSVLLFVGMLGVAESTSMLSATFII